jgi:hypothetical protein
MQITSPAARFINRISNDAATGFMETIMTRPKPKLHLYEGDVKDYNCEIVYDKSSDARAKTVLLFPWDDSWSSVFITLELTLSMAKLHFQFSQLPPGR